MTAFSTTTSRHEDSHHVRFLAQHDPEFRNAMRLVLCGNPRQAVDADRLVDALIASARRQNLHLEPLAAAFTGPRLLTAALIVESPGRTGLLYLPPTEFNAQERAALAGELIPAVAARASQRGMVLLQSLVRPHDRSAAAILEAAGFNYLTELVYLVRRTSSPVPRRIQDRGVQWITYDESWRDLFTSALDESYVETLDCRGLSGLRRTADVLEGHRATGIYDPAGWFVARTNDRTMGVVLTAQTPGRSSLEVVYMGVSPSWRGKGVGDLLMARVAQQARALRLSDITLAVDGVNVAARRLYERWSFVETARRRAWIICPSKRDLR